MNQILEITPQTTRVRSTPFRTKNRALCLSCQKPVALMSIESATEFYKTNVYEIKFLARNIILHPVHNNRGELMICTDSLFTFFEQRQTQPLDANVVSFT